MKKKKTIVKLFIMPPIFETSCIYNNITIY